ncbi:MAG: DUF5719 family protein [Microbacteriaceae bacterium]
MTEPDGPSGPAPRPSARAVALASARVALAVTALGVAIATVGAAVILPLPRLVPTPASTVVTPVATAQSLVCPGAMLRLGDESGTDATSASAYGTASVQLSGDAARTALNGAGAPLALSSDAGADTVSGAQAESLDGSGATGLAVAACAPVSSDTWLVGGSTAVGRTTLVTLANPSDVPAVVDLALWGEEGAIQAAGASGIRVEPGSQQVVSLAGLAPDTASPVVHVTSSGGLIVASLQETVVRGLETAGADLVGGTAAASQSLVIPGVVIRGSAALEARQGADTTDASADLATALRLFAPGGTPATVTVGIVPLAGGQTESFEATVSAATVLDVPLGVLDDGEYTITVTSDVPVVGAVRASTASSDDTASGTSDVAWSVVPPRLVVPASATVVDGPSPRLHVTNPGTDPVDVTIVDPSGTATTQSVAGGATTSLDAVAGGYTLSATGTIAADVEYASDGQLGGYAVLPAATGADPVRVYS